MIHITVSTSKFIKINFFGQGCALNPIAELTILHRPSSQMGILAKTTGTVSQRSVLVFKIKACNYDGTHLQSCVRIS